MERAAATPSRRCAMPPEYHFYAGLKRGKRRAFLAGPFLTREEANSWVGKAHELAERADPWCHFDIPGVFRVPASITTPGRLNADLGLSPDSPHYVSPPVFVRAVAWRVLVVTAFRERAMTYEFRRKADACWLPHRQWPRHDLNRPFLGLPRRAVKTLWAKHRAEIEAALADD